MERLKKILDNLNEVFPGFNTYIIVNAIVVILGGLVLGFLITQVVIAVKCADFRSLFDAGCSLFKDERKNILVDKVTGHRRRLAMRDDKKYKGFIYMVIKYQVKPMIKLALPWLILLIVSKFCPELYLWIFKIVPFTQKTEAVVTDMASITILIAIAFVPFTILWLFFNPYISALLTLLLTKKSEIIDTLEVCKFSDAPNRVLNVLIMIVAVLSGLTVLLRVIYILRRLPAFCKLWYLRRKNYNKHDLEESRKIYAAKKKLEHSTLENRKLREDLTPEEYASLTPSWAKTPNKS